MKLNHLVTGILLSALIVSPTLRTARAADAATTQEASGTITGTVVDDAGKPVSGCIVAAQQSAQKMRLPLDATTDDKGAFKIENVPPGEYNLKIRTSDAKGKATKTVNVAAGKTADAGKLKLKSK